MMEFKIGDVYTAYTNSKGDELRTYEVVGVTATRVEIGEINVSCTGHNISNMHSRYTDPYNGYESPHRFRSAATEWLNKTRFEELKPELIDTSVYATQPLEWVASYRKPWYKFWR